MSDQSQGPGWWQASDGKWYPPEQAPVPPPQPSTQPFGTPFPPAAPSPTPSPMPPPASPPPGRSGLGTGPIIAIVVAAIAVIAGIVFFATKDDGNKKNVAATESSSSSSSKSSSSTRSSSSSKSSSSSGAPKITAPSGFKAFTSDKDQFAIAIPERLQIIDLTASDLDQVLQQLSDSNPALAKLAPQIRQVFQSGGKLFAIDANSPSSSGFNDNINIIATPGAVDVTSGSTKSQAESQLSTIGATNVEFQTLTSNGRKILVSSYQATVNTADGTPVNFFGRQAIISAGGKVWFITFSSGVDDPAAFQTMAESFDVSG